MKTKTFLIAMLLSTIVLSGCKKKDVCEKNDTGWLRITYTGSDYIHVYMDGSSESELIRSGTEELLELSTGLHNAKVRVITPSPRTEYFSVNIIQCEYTYKTIN